MNNNQKIEVLKRIISEESGKINTAVAGNIISYDSANNRAVVKPVGSVRFADNRTLPYPTIYNVPLVFPSSMGGSCGVSLPIRSGDGCLIVFSQDNMSEFMGNGKSDDTQKFQLNDAIAIPGLYNASVAGESKHSNSLTLFYGDSFITLDSGGFIGKLADGTNFNFSGGDLVVNGISLTKHVHGGIMSGGSNTAKPK